MKSPYFPIIPKQQAVKPNYASTPCRRCGDPCVKDRYCKSCKEIMNEEAPTTKPGL